MVIVSSDGAVLAENGCFGLFAAHAALTVVSVTSAGAVSVGVVVNAMGVLRRLLAILRSLHIFRTRPRLNISNVHIPEIFSCCCSSWISRSMHLLCKLSRIVDLIILNLSRLQTASLVFLVNLIWLFLRTPVEIATGYRKLFHLNLRIDRVVIMRLLRMIFVSRISFFLNRFNSTFLAWRTLRINGVWIYLRR